MEGKKFDYRYFGDDGKIYFYYGIGDVWGYIDPDTKEKNKIKILDCYLSEGANGNTQYYNIALNGVKKSKAVSAARLHFLFKNDGKKLVVGIRKELPEIAEQRTVSLSNIDFLISIARGVNPITGEQFNEKDLLCNIKVSKRLYDLAYELKDDLKYMSLINKKK
ncbi:MAG: hypothetical protein NC033_04545 [Clostridiales bacterium]|nr:hypothetical protein [Clostridiales bacterium]